MRHITLLVVVVAVTPLSNIRAQDSLPVTVGDRVRVTAPDIDLNRYDGTIRVIGRNALTVDTLPIALESVTRLDIHRGRKSKSGTGALIGAGIGLVYFAYIASVCSRGFVCTGDVLVAAFTIVVGGGAGIGALVGWLIKTDRWEEVPLNQLRVSVVPQRDGRFALGFSVAF